MQFSIKTQIFTILDNTAITIVLLTVIQISTYNITLKCPNSPSVKEVRAQTDLIASLALNLDLDPASLGEHTFNVLESWSRLPF